MITPTWAADIARFDRYENVGNSIVPAVDARLERFDSWSEYRDAVGRARVIEPPYVSLLNLAKGLRFEQSPFTLWQPSEEGKREILTWCSRHGLLGVMPAIFREVTLPAVWTTAPSGTPRILTPHFVLGNGVWYDRSEVNLFISWTPEHLKSAQEGAPVPADVVRPNPKQTGALVWHWEYYDVEHEALTKSFYSFFPRVLPAEQNGYRYPALGCDAFWHVYGERFDVFGRWATRFLEAAQILMDADYSLSIHQQGFPVQSALLFMNCLASTAGNSFEIDPGAGHVRSVHHCPALLVSFAQMFLQDLGMSRRLRSCATCTRFFVSTGVDVQYCSTRCRNTMQRRRFRKAQKTN